MLHISMTTDPIQLQATVALFTMLMSLRVWRVSRRLPTLLVPPAWRFPFFGADFVLSHQVSDRVESNPPVLRMDEALFSEAVISFSSALCPQEAYLLLYQY